MRSCPAPARERWSRVGVALFALALAAASCGDRGHGARAAGPARHEVVIRAFAFTPPTLTVAAGDTVVWRNEDIVPHTATAVDRGWSSDSLAAGGTWRRVFVERGTHPYACLFHPVMKGRIEAR